MRVACRRGGRRARAPIARAARPSPHKRDVSDRAEACALARRRTTRWSIAGRGRGAIQLYVRAPPRTSSCFGAPGRHGPVLGLGAGAVMRLARGRRRAHGGGVSDAARARSRLWCALGSVHAAAGAAAMAAGILSVALALAGFAILSLVWLVLAAAIGVLLVVAVLVRLTVALPQIVAEADTPAALTAVAATAVLGSRLVLLGSARLAVGALAASFVAWLVLLPAVVGHWRTPTRGVHFLLCVATQSLAALGAALTIDLRAPWLGALALAAWLLGLVFYVVVLHAFSWRELREGAGDQWVLVGALAISALAAGELVKASHAAAWSASTTGALRSAALALVGLTLAGFAALVGAEVRWPRLAFDVRRWSTAFPLGMTAAASMTAASVARVAPLDLAGRVLVWPAFAVSSVLLVAWARRLAHAPRASRTIASYS